MNTTKLSHHGQKKVFDVVRPGKTMAGSNARPTITGNKPGAANDQFVAVRGASPTNPHQRLMRSKKLAIRTVPADAVASAGVSGLPAKKPLSQQPAPPRLASSRLKPEPEVKAKPAKPDTIEVTSGDVEERISVGVATNKSAPAPTVPRVADSPTLAGIDDLLTDTDDDAPAKKINTVEITSDSHPEEVVSDALPKASAKEDEVDKNDKPAATDGAPPTAGPDLSAPIAVKPSLSHTEIMAGAGMTMPRHDDEDARPVVSHHKNHMGWWQWLLVVVLILVIGLAIFNFVLDAELIDTELDIPHTNLL